MGWRWADVDPTLWPAPPDLEERAFHVALDAMMSTPMALRADTPRRSTAYPDADPLWQQRVFSAVGDAFFQAFGPWTLQWRACSEGGWLYDDDGQFDPAPGARRAARALVRSRQLLLDERALFASLDPWLLVEPGQDQAERDAAIAVALDHACGVLVASIAERTLVEHAWHLDIPGTLSWYLQFHGADPAAAAAAARVATSGRFHSWTEPDEETVRSAAADWTVLARRALAAGRR